MDTLKPTAIIEARLRLDKWLWHARFHKSRTLAAAACATGRIRLNGIPVEKSHQKVAPGDVLTFPLGARIRIVRVVALGARRGPASEAQALYEDLTPPADAVAAAADASAPVVGHAGGARPTKAERRALDRLHDREPSGGSDR